MRLLVMESKNAYGEWEPMGEMYEGQQPDGSMSNNNADGSRDIIVFGCKDGRSTIKRSVGGADVSSSVIRATIPMAGWQTLAELSDGESFEIDIQTDKMTAPLPIRFRQVLA